MSIIQDIVEHDFDKRKATSIKETKSLIEFKKAMDLAKNLILGKEIRINAIRKDGKEKEEIIIKDKAEIFSIRSHEEYDTLIKIGLKVWDAKPDFFIPFPVMVFHFNAEVYIEKDRKTIISNMANLICESGDGRYFYIMYSDLYKEKTGEKVLPLYAGWFSFISGQFSCSLSWSCMNSDEITKQDIYHQAVSKCVSLIFAINTPGVSKQESINWDPKIQKSRAKKGKYPLANFKRLYIDIPKEHYKGGNYTEKSNNQGVRFHSVIGHVRKIERGEERKAVWIRPHFRGDAALGVVSKERVLRPGKNE